MSLPPEQPKCTGCGAYIIWVKTEAGKSMPIDFDQRFYNAKLFIRNLHIPHWATCHNAKDFRKNKV